MRRFGTGGRFPPCTTKGQLRALCYQYGGKSETGLGPPGSSENWRCIAVEKLTAVEPLDGPWQAAPNHSRPASCIVDPDIDAEVVEVKAVDAGLRLQTGALEATFDGAPLTRFQFHIGEQFESSENTEIAPSGISDSRFDLAAHRSQIQLLQFLFERCHRVPFRIRE